MRKHQHSTDLLLSICCCSKPADLLDKSVAVLQAGKLTEDCLRRDFTEYFVLQHKTSKATVLKKYLGNGSPARRTGKRSEDEWLICAGMCISISEPCLIILALV